MAEHPLHKAVGDLLKKFATKNGFEERLDEACGKKQRLPLFSSHEISSESRLCCVDAMLLKNDKVAVVVEVEESNIKPTQICGKYLTTALAVEYNYKDIESASIEKGSVDFIQILDTKKLNEASHKEEQFKKIEDAINRDLRGCVRSYNIISINWAKEKDSPVLKDKLYKILNKIKESK